MNDRLKQQMQFIMQIDKMKNILRQTLLMDGSRQETDAEHSWHLATMAMLLHEHAACPDVDVQRVIQMALIHDLVEIYAGDTFAYDPQANLEKEKREKEAADRLFALLPEDQGGQLRALWEEFDRMDTPDALYAAALDRLQPFLSNYATDGYTWKLGHVSAAQIYRRMDAVRVALPALWDFVEDVIRDAVAKGYVTQE